MADFRPNTSAPVIHLPVVSRDPARDHYEVGGLVRFASCPLSYKLASDEAPTTGDDVRGRFAALLAHALDEIVSDHVLSDDAGGLRRASAAETYRRVWSECLLTDPALFAEGLALVESWVARQNPLFPDDVLALREDFELQIGPIRLSGTLPRVDSVADDTIRVRVVRSTRRPIGREDAEQSLELAIYDLAARELWPWAKRVELSFDVLRHGVLVTIERTAAQREATRQYILAAASQIQSRHFPARLSTGCTRCDHRSRCAAFADARAGKRHEAGADLRDLPAVAREREELAVVLKALGERKDALDDVLRAQLADQPEPELLLEGHRYTLSVAMRRDYPLEATLAAFERAGIPRERALEALGAVDGSALKTLLAELEHSLSPARFSALKGTIEREARCSPVTRLLAREVRS